jgi:YggT family protein
LISLIRFLTQIITLVVLAQALMSYFVAPYHPVRQRLDRLMEPVYAPIRRILPSTGMIDFSPLVFLILLQIISRLVIGLLSSI